MTNIEFELEKFLKSRQKPTLEFSFPLSAYSSAEDVIQDYLDIYCDKNNKWTQIWTKHYLSFIFECFEEAKSGSCLSIITDCMSKIRNLFADYRNELLVTYPLDVLLMVILLARISGNTTAKDIVNYYRKHCLELVILIPGMPNLHHQLSVTTVNTALANIDAGEVRKFFSAYFSKIVIGLKERIGYHDDRIQYREDNLKDTYAFDGQEQVSSYKKGTENRRVKGAQIVSLADCTNQGIIDYIAVDKKNNEKTACLELFFNTVIKDKVIMSDALNTQSSVTDQILESGADYLMPIKANGNKELKLHVEAIFNREHKHSAKVTSEPLKDHGRVEEYAYEILPAQEYLDHRIKNQHKKVNTLVKYHKKVTSLIDGNVKGQSDSTRYYISSLEYNEKTIAQVKASIEDYWFIEEHHSIIDDPLIFDQDNLHGCIPNTLSNNAGLNKIGFNILGFIRQKLTKERNLKTPIPYKSVEKELAAMSIFELLPLLNEYWFSNTEDC
jgi:predicted transposase YbfD/YdcC